jgi:hypothetical protein
MDDQPKVTRDIQYGSDQQSKAVIAHTLSQLRAFGDQFGRYTADDIDPRNILQIKSLLLDLNRELAKELKYELSKECDSKHAEIRSKAIEKLISHIEDDILLDVAVLNTYMIKEDRSISSYDPDVVRKLYKTIKSLGKELKALPKNI